MSENSVPKTVELRDESVRMKPCRRFPLEEEEFELYRYKFDAELESMIAAARGDAIGAFARWFESARKTMGKTGVKLIPGPIQQLCGLPVRQIYADLGNNAAYRIEADGQVTEKLL